MTAHKWINTHYDAKAMKWVKVCVWCSVIRNKRTERKSCKSAP